MTGEKKLRDDEKYILPNSNYVWRIVFTFTIVLGHSGLVDISHASYYIGVDYFFIISGFFLAKGSGKNGDTIKYTINRIKKLYPHVILSFIIFFVWCYKSADNMLDIIRGLVYHLNQIVPMLYLILPGAEGETNYLNFSTWYISVLLICGILVHYLYTKHRELTVSVIAPLVVLFGYAYMGKMSFNTGDQVGLFLNSYYVRGFAGMYMGVLIYEAVMQLRKIPFSRLAYILFHVIEYISFGLLLWIIRYCGNNANDIYFVGLISLGILMSFMYEAKIDLIMKKMKWLNDLMYPVYLNHLFVLAWLTSRSWFGNILNVWHKGAIIVMYIVLLIWSMLTNNLLRGIKYINKKYVRDLLIKE